MNRKQLDKNFISEVWQINAKTCKEHPAPFPIELPLNCIKLTTLPGDTVLDPFMGWGTTGVACVNTNRRFIGIELDDGYFNIAKKRIEEAYAD